MKCIPDCGESALPEIKSLLNIANTVYQESIYQNFDEMTWS